MHLAVSSSFSCQALRKASLQCRAASKKKRQCHGSRGGGPRRPPRPRTPLLLLLALLLRSLSVVPWLCASALPELVRVRDEGPCDELLADAPPAVANDRPSLLPPPPRRDEDEASEDVEEAEEPRLLLLPGGRPGPRTCGTHLIPRAVQIWHGLRRLQRFWCGGGGIGSVRLGKCGEGMTRLFRRPPRHACTVNRSIN
jgi:hypothetical protein